MKKTISILLLIILILYLLLFPAEGVAAAAHGLLLWYQSVLPVLLPFAIISDIMISTNAFYLICNCLYPVLHLVLPVSRAATFPLFAGFLFGFPMGSRICAQMLGEQKLGYGEADVLYRICNNLSPAFICNYIVLRIFGREQLILPTYLILYLPALVYGRLLYTRAHKEHMITDIQIPASGFRIDFKIIDAGIMNGFETLVRLGGYIMLFAIYASAIQQLPLHLPVFSSILIGLTEITNGVNAIETLNVSFAIKYALILALTAFGGLSGIAQTSAMISNSPLTIRSYIKTRILLAITSGSIALLFAYCCDAL